MRRRFVDRRLDGLVDEPRPGSHTIGDEQIEAGIGLAPGTVATGGRVGKSHAGRDVMPNWVRAGADACALTGIDPSLPQGGGGDAPGTVASGGVTVRSPLCRTLFGSMLRVERDDSPLDQLA